MNSKKGIQMGRSLYPEELEVRVDAISEKSFTLVVYITSRSAMNILDDIYGPNNWSKNVSVAKTDSGYYANCRLTISKDGESIVREDIGEDEKSAKAAASDSIKRAATNFIPELRALYTIPMLRIYAKNLGIGDGKENIKNAIKFKSFAVSSIIYGTSATGTFIKSLQIIDADTGELVHEFLSKKVSLGTIASPELLSLKDEIEKAGLTEEQVLKDYKAAYGINTLDDLVKTNLVLAKVYDRIAKTKEQKGKKKASVNAVNEQLKGKANKEE